MTDSIVYTQVMLWKSCLSHAMPSHSPSCNVDSHRVQPRAVLHAMARAAARQIWIMLTTSLLSHSDPSCPCRTAPKKLSNRLATVAEAATMPAPCHVTCNAADTCYVAFTANRAISHTVQYTT